MFLPELKSYELFFFIVYTFLHFLQFIFAFGILQHVSIDIIKIDNLLANNNFFYFSTKTSKQLREKHANIRSNEIVSDLIPAPLYQVNVNCLHFARCEAFIHEYWLI